VGVDEENVVARHIDADQLADPQLGEWHDVVPDHRLLHGDHKTGEPASPASASTRPRAALAAWVVRVSSRPAAGSLASRRARPAAASSARGDHRATHRPGTSGFSAWAATAKRAW